MNGDDENSFDFYVTLSKNWDVPLNIDNQKCKQQKNLFKIYFIEIFPTIFGTNRSFKV